MAYRSHPLFFGGAEFSGGLSMEDRQSLLEQENLLAEERDAKARQFQLDMERERKAQEGQMAELTKRQEADRVAALEQQEQAAAEYATPETDLASKIKNEDEPLCGEPQLLVRHLILLLKNRDRSK